jgi:O-antigen ligase
MDTRERLKSSQLYFISFTAVLVLLPWSITLTNYAIALASITGLLSTTFSEKINRIKQNKQIVIFFALYLLYIIGLLYSSNIVLGIKSIEQKLVLLVIPLIAASSLAFKDQQREFSLRAFVYSNAIFILTCIVLNLIDISGGPPYTHVNFDPFTLSRFNEFHPDAAPIWMQFSYIAFTSPILSSPTFISIYLSLSVFILFYLQPVKLKYVLIVLFSLIILLLSSRMGVMILICIGLPIILHDLVKKKFPLRYSVVSSGFILLIFLLIIVFPVTRFRLIEEPLNTPIDLPSDASNWNSINLRFLEWKSGIEGIKAHGITGTGTGDALGVLDSYYNQVDLGIFDHQYLSHNQFIETTLEIGIAGFVALLLCLIVPFMQGLKTKNVLLMSVVVMTCLACLSTSFFEKARGLTFYVSFISLLMFTKSQEESGSKA